MSVPSPLKPSDSIGIVTPARKVDEKQLLWGCDLINSWGLNVVMGKYAVSTKNNYLAAEDGERLDDFQKMLDDPDIKAVFCSRGGYGMTRILDDLNFDAFLENPKWIIGFSDITALHLKLHTLGAESIHGCMPVQFHKKEYWDSVESLRSILFGKMSSTIACDSNSLNKIGVANGQVVGGNLSLVTDSLGSVSALNTKGKILILEEIDETIYKVDRMLMQLKRAGKLNELAGLVIGHMTDINDTELPFGESIEQIVIDKVDSFSFPVAFNFPIGHKAPNLAWRHGASATLLVESDKSSLSF